ncbi:WD40 repeat domain-containing protein [Nostoc sp. TCL26-01]|uniref:NACHT and WD repeat domain-containing protein n=1 Tax=Nostoc sp. TCL26-01 TaxID=2576904 RepID=UPI0015BDAC83|nr:WD40 repeat domain-containing protein [Nostoc sp. TCL26-01]
MNQEFPSSQQNISNVSIGDSNVVTFNQTQILQISVAEIKTRQFIQTSPYKGLKKFESADKDLFFGRDQFLTGLVNELEQTNLILLLGASGSGKSSVVRAGLIPWLSQKWGSHLVNLTLTPDIDPFESFYASLLSKYKQAEAQIARNAQPDTLTEVVKSLKQPNEHWFILIDQFEELFTTSLADKRDNFIASLVQLSKTKEHSVKIMMTMRADFLDRLSPYPQLVKATDRHRPLIAEMQIDELRLAIEQPAAQYGVVFETGLVEEIIKDIQGQAGYLPLLQYTLNLLWETEVQTGSINDRTLNISTYRELGGVRGALQKHVDQIYSALLEPEKLATQRIFLKLVGIGGNSESITEWKPVRRRANRFEFSDQLEQSVLVKFINENLLVSDRQPQAQESTVEIAHEILLTSWETLNTWIKENRQAIVLRNRLNDDVVRWQSKKKEDELWSGSRLEQVLELRKDPTFNQVLGGFSEAGSQFIDASVGLRDRQRRRTIIGLTSFSAFALFLAGFAGWQWRQSEIAKSDVLIRSAEILLSQGKEFEALIESLQAGILLQHLKAKPSMQLVTTLWQTVSDVKERNLLEGHNDSVNSVYFSPDGKILASCSNDTIKLWDVTTGKEILTLNEPNNRVYYIRFSPNGKTLAAVTSKGIKLWDMAMVREIRTLSVGNNTFGYEESPISVSFSADGKTLAFGFSDDTIKILDVASGKEIRTFTGANADLDTGISFSLDGKTLASRRNKTIKIRNVATGKEIRTFAAVNIDFDTIISFSPDGKTLAFTATDNTIKLRDIATGKETHIITGANAKFNTINFSPDGTTLAFGSNDNTITLWDVTTGKKIHTLTRHNGSINSVSFSPNGTTLASGSNDNTIKLWNITKRKEIRTLNGHSATIRSVSFNPDGKTLTSRSDDNTIKLWDITTEKEIRTFKPWNVATGKENRPITKSNSVVNVNFASDSKTLVSGGSDGIIKLWDASTGKVIHTMTGHSNAVISVSFSPDGKTLVSNSYDETIKLWDIATGKEIRSLKDEQFLTFSFSFSPDSKTLASPSSPAIQLWDVATLKKIRTLTGHKSTVNSVSFSTDGKTLVSGSNDKTIKLWDVTTGKEIRTLTGHTARVNSVSFSTDGKTLVSGSDDKTIKLWDVATGKEIRTLTGHTARVNSVSFSADAKTLASGSDDKTVILWNLNFDSLLVRGCNWVSAYVQNSTAKFKDSEKHLCDGISTEK